MTRMLNWIWGKLDALTNWPAFFVLLLFFLVFSALFNLYGAHYPVDTFDGHKYGVSRADIRDILDKFHKCGQLDQYRAQETQLDLAFPAIYGLLFAVAIAGLWPRGGRWLALLPLATALFDYCENFTFIALAMRYRKTQTTAPALEIIGSTASRLKWSFVIVSLAALGVALIMAALRAVAAARAD